MSIFQRQQIAQASRASAICSLWKIYKCLLHQIAREHMLLLVLHKPVGQVQFVVFENFTSAYYAKLQENTYYYLLTIYRKNITESQHRQNFENVHMLFVICTLVTTLH